MAILNLRGDQLSTSSQDEVTILNQQIVDLSAIVEVLPITDLSDVTITTPVTGQVLVYNSGTGDWENSDIDGGTY